MSKRTKHQGAKSSHAPAPRHEKSQFHKDWRTWAVVGLMLAAMFAYVMSDDEALVPGENGDEPVVPAAVE